MIRESGKYTNIGKLAFVDALLDAGLIFIKNLKASYNYKENYSYLVKWYLYRTMYININTKIKYTCLFI